MYRTLQVDPEAEVDVIRAAYRVLAAKNHPDVGGSADQMSMINRAWNTLSNPTARAAYDRERRLRNGGDKWDAYAASTSSSAQARSIGTVLEFGRYAGWSIAEVAQADPDFLEWLARTPNGRRYQSEIDEILSRGIPVAMGAPAPSRRSGLGRR
jgi:curved DNA-binding protein CbpA